MRDPHLVEVGGGGPLNRISDAPIGTRLTYATKRHAHRYVREEHCWLYQGCDDREKGRHDTQEATDAAG